MPAVRDPYYDGPSVIVTARVASGLRPLAKRMLREARNEGRRLDDELLATIHALDHAGRVYVEGRLMASSDSGTPRLPITEDASPSDLDGWLSTSAVADHLGCSERNVVRLIHTKRLVSTRLGHQHLIDPGELARFMEERQKAR